MQDKAGFEMGKDRSSSLSGAMFPSIERRLVDAVFLHKEGRLLEAEKIYQEVLRQVPEHAEASHLLGVVAYQKGDLQEAEALIIKSIKLE